MVGAIDEYTVAQLKEYEVHWKEKPLEEGTWEGAVDFQTQCPYTSLGDKAGLREEDIVRRINRPRPKVTHVYTRRPKAQEKSRQYK
ncbi:hypothetical protein F511_19692 [Dorcoceras hygrometricum]|uniref:Chromo domain-containing protein n=1 Tax=Dorcoceras hygrometricum TaxID=472368 RepID=A0A2Z7ATD8_9LAMI|nr:hypothetical protein F511_19692 [Dorcoceras hygrometricum]